MNTSESTVPLIEAFNQSGSSPPSPLDNNRVRLKFGWQPSAQRVGVRSIRIHPLDLRNWMADGMPTRPQVSRYRQPTLGGG